MLLMFPFPFTIFSFFLLLVKETKQWDQYSQQIQLLISDGLNYRGKQQIKHQDLVAWNNLHKSLQGIKLLTF